MTLLVRAVVHASDASRLATDGLLAVGARGIAALASPDDGVPVTTETSLRVHEQITRRIHDGAASLPARFGTVYETEDEVRRLLTENRTRLLADLERVGGRVELVVSMRWRNPASEDTVATTGRAYLEARRVRMREEDAAREVVARFVAELGLERAFIRESISPRPGVAASVALLIERERVGMTRADIASFAARESAVQVEAYGPMAPYSFSS